MRFALLFLSAFLAASCVPNRSYRARELAVFPGSQGCANTGNIQLEQGPWVLSAGTADVSKKGFKLGFIEFDDFGEFFNRCELNSVIQTIDQAKRMAGSVVVVVFVHGWKNNASDQSGNVWGFRDELADIARRSHVPPNVPVLGIYLGWRGDVLKLGKNFTFWDRRDTATHIGGAHMTETLLAIVNATKGLRYTDPSVCVLVGHSFGGLLLEHALTQTLVNVFERESAEQQSCKTVVFSPPVDLIAFINEAAPAIEAKKTLEYLSAHNVHLFRDSREYPVILSMTSQTDLATKLALPGGQALSLPFNSLRSYKQPDAFGITQQRSYYLQSTANMTALQSHVIGGADDPDIAKAFRNHPESQFKEVSVGGVDYRVLRIQNAKNTTAYWVMQIPSKLVPDHGTIFRPEFRRLLEVFLPPVPEKQAAPGTCADRLPPSVRMSSEHNSKVLFDRMQVNTHE